MRVKTVGPRAKIILYISLIIIAFISNSDKVNLFLLCIVSAFSFKAPLSALKRGAVPIVFFLTFTFISNAFFHEGRKVYEIFGLSLTEEGIIRGGRLTLRLFILILGAKILTATTKAEELVAGISGLLGPVGRIDFVRELVFTMSMTLRLLPIVYNEALDLYKNVKNSEGTSITGKVKLAVSLLTPLFERSLQKAKEMSGAGESL